MWWWEGRHSYPRPATLSRRSEKYTHFSPRDTCHSQAGLRFLAVCTFHLSVPDKE